jgi:hypothetical protein
MTKGATVAGYFADFSAFWQQSSAAGNILLRQGSDIYSFVTLVRDERI